MVDLVDWVGRDMEDPHLRAIMGVCRSFRRFAIDLPSLWCEIKVNLTHNKGHAWLGLKLERSKSRALDLSITAGDSTEPGSNWGLKKLEAIFPHSTRWRSLTLDASFDTLMADFAAIEGKLPSLASLELFVGSSASLPIQARHTLPQFFSKVPHLRTISIFAWVNLDCSALPLHQLRHFSVEGMVCRPITGDPHSDSGPAHLATLLQPDSQCQSLVVTPSETYQWAHERTTAPQLRHLEIDDWFHNWMERFAGSSS